MKGAQDGYVGVQVFEGVRARGVLAMEGNAGD